MKKFLHEFKEFALKGNVIDLAVGVIIGGAFQAIVNAFINDLVMPWIGLLTGGVNFADQFVILKLPEGVTEAEVKSIEIAKELGVTTFNYGSFITAVINFLIMAFVIFMFVRSINRLTAAAESRKHKDDVPAAPTTKICPFCKSEIAIDATRCPHCTSEITE